VFARRRLELVAVFLRAEGELLPLILRDVLFVLSLVGLFAAD